MKNPLLNSYKTVLILNKNPHIVQDNFYMDLCRIPEILSYLHTYRKILSKRKKHIPVWVYCLTENITKLNTRPTLLLLNFIVNLGLFERYLKKRAFPHYVIGQNTTLNVITKKTSFEEQCLSLDSFHSPTWFLYKISKYPLCFSELDQASNAETLIRNLVTDNLACTFQFLSPHTVQKKFWLESKGLQVRDFIENDSELKWLWPLWQKFMLNQ